MNEHLPPSADDATALATDEAKLHGMGDQVGAVMKSATTDVHVCGNGGVAKSFAVLNRLESLITPYRLNNSRMTGKELFLRLRDTPAVVHVLEDMERAAKDADAQGAGLVGRRQRARFRTSRSWKVTTAASLTSIRVSESHRCKLRLSQETQKNGSNHE
jgi:hypothetical protein